MAEAYAGKDGAVFVGTKDAKVTGFTVNPKVNTFDTTTTADGGHDDVCASTKSCDGSFDFLYLTAAGDDPFKPTGLNLRHGSTVDLVLYVFKATVEANSIKLAGKALIEQLSVKHAVKGGFIVTATFKSKGLWLYPGDDFDDE